MNFDFRTPQEKMDAELAAFEAAHPVVKLAQSSGYNIKDLFNAVQAYGYLGNESRQEVVAEGYVLEFVKKHVTKAKKTGYGFQIKVGWKGCYFTEKNSYWYCFLPSGSWGWSEDKTIVLKNQDLLNLINGIVFEQEVLSESK